MVPGCQRRRYSRVRGLVGGAEPQRCGQHPGELFVQEGLEADCLSDGVDGALVLLELSEVERAAAAVSQPASVRAA